VDVEALERAFRRLRRKAAPGVDGVTVETYEGKLADNLCELCDRVHSGRTQSGRSMPSDSVYRRFVNQLRSD
jgi:RNA-directed DNA polymerase